MFSIVSETWNPVTGCRYYCKYCWARRLALVKLRNTKRYSNGFKPSIHGEEFRKKFREGVVFVSDMGDLFGEWVPREWIIRVIEHVKKFPKTYFLFLTKNPERYFEFLDIMPRNVILGVTIETNRDEIVRSISRAPAPSERYRTMKNLNWPLKLVSIEPIMDFDIDILEKWIMEIKPLIIYIGYDNYNNKLPEPTLRKTLELITKVQKRAIVVKKTIRHAWYEGVNKFEYR